MHSFDARERLIKRSALAALNLLTACGKDLNSTVSFPVWCPFEGPAAKEDR